MAAKQQATVAIDDTSMSFRSFLRTPYDQKTVELLFVAGKPTRNPSVTPPSSRLSKRVSVTGGGQTLYLVMNPSLREAGQERAIE